MMTAIVIGILIVLSVLVGVPVLVAMFVAIVAAVRRKPKLHAAVAELKSEPSEPNDTMVRELAKRRLQAQLSELEDKATQRQIRKMEEDLDRADGIEIEE